MSNLFGLSNFEAIILSLVLAFGIVILIIFCCNIYIFLKNRSAESEENQNE
jgi:hypothetical protein